MLTATYDPQTLTATATALTNRGTVAASLRPIYHADVNVVRLVLVTHSSFDRTDVEPHATHVDTWCHVLETHQCWCNVEGDRFSPNLAVGERLSEVTNAVCAMLKAEPNSIAPNVDPVDFLFSIADGVYDAGADICYPVPAATEFDVWWYPRNAAPAAVLVDDTMMETNRAIAHIAALVTGGDPVSVWLVPPGQVVRLTD